MDKRIDSAEISRLRGLCEAATPGPWKDYRDTFEPAVYTKLEDGCRGACISRLAGLYTHGNRENAAFIAASRQALPELLDEIERLKKLVDNNSAMGADRNDILIEAVAAANAADARIERLQAEAAALREALNAAKLFIPGAYMMTSNMGRCNECGYMTSSGAIKLCSKCTAKKVEQALSTTAGADLLARLQRCEAALQALNAMARLACDEDCIYRELEDGSLVCTNDQCTIGVTLNTTSQALQKEAAPC